MPSTEDRARAAQRLLDDADLCAVLDEIEEAGTRAFLASGGNPDAMAEAHHKVRAVATLRTALKIRVTDQAVAAKKER